PEPHTFGGFKTADLEVDAAIEDVVVRAAVGLQRADVLPVAVEHLTLKLQARVEHGRKHVAREIDDLTFRDVVEDAGLEHVDTGIDRVGEHLPPGGLFEKALDGAVVARNHDAELNRILDALERNRRERAAFAMLTHDLAEVEVGDDVARDDEER